DVPRLYKQAAALVADFGLRGFETPLGTLARDDGVDEEVRAEAILALARLKEDGVLIALASAVVDPRLPVEMVDTTSRCFGADALNGKEAAAAMMQAATVEVQARLAEHLAQTRDGAELLLKLIEAGRASAFLLQDQALVKQLVAAFGPDSRPRIAGLTAALPDRSQAVAQLVDQRRSGFKANSASPSRGQQAFKRHCAACHQIQGQGALIGPQLDGIGQRGLERILEDVLDPNRNVDQAFRASLFVLDDGRVLSGLFRREEGTQVVIADQ